MAKQATKQQTQQALDLIKLSDEAKAEVAKALAEFGVTPDEFMRCALLSILASESYLRHDRVKEAMDYEGLRKVEVKEWHMQDPKKGEVGPNGTPAEPRPVLNRRLVAV